MSAEGQTLLRRAYFHILGHSMNYEMEMRKPLSRYPLTEKEIRGVTEVIQGLVRA